MLCASSPSGIALVGQLVGRRLENWGVDGVTYVVRSAVNCLAAKASVRMWYFVAHLIPHLFRVVAYNLVFRISWSEKFDNDVPQKQRTAANENPCAPFDQVQP